MRIQLRHPVRGIQVAIPCDEPVINMAKKEVKDYRGGMKIESLGEGKEGSMALNLFGLLASYAGIPGVITAASALLAGLLYATFAR